MASTIRLRVHYRGPEDERDNVEVFEFPLSPNMNVISALREVQRNPVNSDGKSVRPPAWEAACLEEVCGSCTMIVNGMARQACTALIEDVGIEKDDVLEVTLQAMTKFPIIRDLIVDRSAMFETLKKLKAWIPIDGSYDRGMAPPQDDSTRQLRYLFSKCMTCGCCMEACPQYSERTEFVGPQALTQAQLFNLHPVGKSLMMDRLDVLSGEEGITNCGNAQNCVRVCPKGIPITRAIAEINRDTTVYRIKKWFGACA